MKTDFIILSHEKPTGLGFETEEMAVNHCAAFSHLSYQSINIIGKSKKKAVSDERKTLFRNSELCANVDFSKASPDFTCIEKEKEFESEEFQSIDIAYYAHAVCNWNDKKELLRTRRGWVATIKDFMRTDSEAKKLKLKLEYRSNHKALSNGTDNYLAGF